MTSSARAETVKRNLVQWGRRYAGLLLVVVLILIVVLIAPTTAP